MASKKKAIDFEQSLTELEALVEKMEKGDLSLEESLAAFSKGIELTRECQARLAEAEQKVSVLLADDDDLELVDFELGDEE